MPTPDIGSPNFLFVCGVARSGTTAMLTLLNGHPEIALGVERYKNIEPRELGQHLFTKERFFDIRPTDTNLHYPKIYEQLEKKYSQARWVGDKVPRYYMRYGELFEKFPGCVVLFMLRDIHSIASSWNRRAANPEDAWPESRNYIHAVKDWNESLRQTLAFKKKFQNRLVVVDYAQLFSGDLILFQSIFEKLNLTLSEDMLDQFRLKTRNWDIFSQKPLLEHEGQADYINAKADMQTFLKLKKFSDVVDVGSTPPNVSGAIRNPLAWARSFLRSAN